MATKKEEENKKRIIPIIIIGSAAIIGLALLARRTTASACTTFDSCMTFPNEVCVGGNCQPCATNPQCNYPQLVCDAGVCMNCTNPGIMCEPGDSCNPFMMGGMCEVGCIRTSYVLSMPTIAVGPYNCGVPGFDVSADITDNSTVCGSGSTSIQGWFWDAITGVGVGMPIFGTGNGATSRAPPLTFNLGSGTGVAPDLTIGNYDVIPEIRVTDNITGQSQSLILPQITIICP